ncbi:MAG: aspartate aminotransferase family protein [Planctomycetes bacterium]|nr:aspartate aminotransferase family protein [Planctomycetota bacterium]
MTALPRAASQALLERNRAVIPGGMVSLNRKVEPAIAFVKARGARVWDADGNEYLDYHAGFAPYLLGHNDPDVNAAVQRTLADEATLMGSGTTPWEGRLCELIAEAVPCADKVQLTCSGSEATYHALRLSRSFTGRDGVVVMLGGYNGWHDAVARAVMPPAEATGPRVSPGEYPFLPLSAGIPDATAKDVHTVNFNDLESVEYVFKKHKIACVIAEPILQNIGIVKPRDGYLKGLRELCDRHGALLVFDEVKTGFRSALGGYQSICGVTPDLATFGKAVANGYPIGAIAGKSEVMDLFDTPDAKRRVLIAGTYNGHPLVVAAAIATIEKLRADGGAVYERLENLGRRMEEGLRKLFADAGVTAHVARQGSAFCAYFMDGPPRDWHDLRERHDFAFDTKYRRALIERGIYHFPMPTKQGSISAAHTEANIDRTLAVTREILAKL